jgi:hypothetical protein
MTDELEKTWKGVVLCWHFPGATEEDHEKLTQESWYRGPNPGLGRCRCARVLGNRSVERMLRQEQGPILG